MKLYLVINKGILFGAFTTIDNAKKYLMGFEYSPEMEIVEGEFKPSDHKDSNKLLKLRG
jgi:hypothetical protein